MTGKTPSEGLFVSRLRRPTLTHAFERALDEAHLDMLAQLHAGPDRGEEAMQRFEMALKAMADVAGPVRVAAPSLAAAYAAEAEQGATIRVPRGAREAPPQSAPPQPAKRPQPLKVRQGLGVRDLKRLRRHYALLNHPDRVSPELREEAARLMAEANAEIDKALKRAGRG